MVTIEYAMQVKSASEAAILACGGRINGGLPSLDRRGVRGNGELIGRALVLNAVIDLNHKVAAAEIRSWLGRHQVRQYLSRREVNLLARKKTDHLQQELHNLDWSIDALWSLMWAGRLFDEMDFSQPIPETMYSMCPHVGEGDGPEKFSERMSIRSFDELYRALDLYYRLHWYAFEYQLRGERDTFDLSRFIERRRALEWLLTPDAAWDDVSMNT